MKAKQAVSYLRVSTREQGQSGLGLEAQRAAVESFCASHGYQVAAGAEYQDVESGKHNERPGLRHALADAKARRATLLIAKLDRLSRNASFIMALRDSGVAFIACDLPEANTLTVGIMALLAQQERELISTRTRAALSALKARGVRLGSPRNNLTDATRAKATRAKREKAIQAANGSLRHAVNYRKAGYSLARIAEELNESGQRARRGGKWTATQVSRLLSLAEGGKA
jgi:DNA invertase Pin-like site-specific DNA recombinase